MRIRIRWLCTRHFHDELIAPPVACDVHKERERDRDIEEERIAEVHAHEPSDRDNERKEHGHQKPGLPDVPTLMRIQCCHIPILPTSSASATCTAA